MQLQSAVSSGEILPPIFLSMNLTDGRFSHNAHLWDFVLTTALLQSETYTTSTFLHIVALKVQQLHLWQTNEALKVQISSFSSDGVQQILHVIQQKKKKGTKISAVLFLFCHWKNVLNVTFRLITKEKYALCSIYLFDKIRFYIENTV